MVVKATSDAFGLLFYGLVLRRISLNKCRDQIEFDGLRTYIVSWHGILWDEYATTVKSEKDSNSDSETRNIKEKKPLLWQSGKYAKVEISKLNRLLKLP
jgi:hypothetical protein